ncbi:MAG: hypothetical protein WC332_00745 [Clostridia bacterium]|jgi:hypothetical protein
MEYLTCALEGCNVKFIKKHKQKYCCVEHAKLANRRQVRRIRHKNNPEKKRLENMPSFRLAGKLIDCECPICGEKHQARNIYRAKYGKTYHFCDECRQIVNADYSEGMGIKYDPRTDKITDFL